MGYWHQSLLFLSWLSAATAVAIAVEEKSSFDVGVILEKGSWIGDVGWICIKISLRDFYKKNPLYKTRLRLHLRDSGDTAFGASSAAMDLLDNEQVQAIIGPQYSKQATFLMAIGSKTHIPVISFSATSPSLSYGQAEYFIRTTFNDSIQVEAIASLIQHFKWKEVIPIYEDDQYGRDTLTLLMDSLQEAQVNVPDQSNISTFATREQIHGELSRLRDKQTKVFVVQISSRSMGTKLFSCAQELKMMDKGYVWIVPYDLIDSSNSALMQGVLGLEPSFPKSRRLTDFKLRWKKEFTKEHPEVNATEPSGFGLWAYDTLQALAEAVESSFEQNSSRKYAYKINSSSDHLMKYSPIGPKLLNSLVHTNFIGLSGKFKLTDQQLSIPGVGIINVVGDSKQRVGSFSGHKIDKIDDNRITWPGDATSKPRGWEWPTNGHNLTVGIPGGERGFKQLRKFCIDVFKKVMERLPYEVPYEYVEFENSNGNMNGTYDDLVQQVYLKKFDVVAGDVTILANRSEYVDFTLPFMGSEAVMVVPVKDYNNKSAWAFLQPMTASLWCAIGVFIILTGVVVWVLERDINNQFSRGMGKIIYFSFSSLVFAHGEKIVSNQARIVLAVWLFAVLTLTSSYTANLTSMLTVRQIKPTVTNIDQLIKEGLKVGYHGESFMLEFLKRKQFRESNLRAFDSAEEYEKALSNGTIAAMVEEMPYVKLFLSDYCGKYTIVGPPYQKHGFGFAFPKGSPLVRDVSKAILEFTATEEFKEMEKKIYKKHNCLNETEETEEESSWASLTLESFWGLFLITGVTSGIAVILHLILVFREIKKSSGSGEGNSYLWETIKQIFSSKNDGGDVTDHRQESDADVAHSLAIKAFEEKLAKLRRSLSELKVKYEDCKMDLNVLRNQNEELAQEVMQFGTKAASELVMAGYNAGGVAAMGCKELLT